MKILFVSDFSLNHNRGGAQRSNDLIIDKGISLGHNITPFNLDTDPKLLHDQYDVVISSNLEVLSRQPIAGSLFNRIVTADKHVRLEHDANRYLSVENRKTLFGSCIKTFFLTQFHYDKFVEMYGDIFINVEIVSDPIDTNIFYDKKEDRIDKILYVGFMHYLKGTENFFEYVLNHPDQQFAMVAWGDSKYQQIAKSIPNIEWLDSVDYIKMPSLYNKYKSLYYHPVGFEPFCRSIGEALLCGMELDCNDLIGSLHHLKEVGREEFIKHCNEATQMFWNRVEDCFV